MTRTKIEWCDYTWNPVWGCTGSCPYCYARKRAKMSGLRVCGRDDFVPTWVEKNFQKSFPKRPSRIFVNSMSDFADWEGVWFNRVRNRILNEGQDHLFLYLSKRPWSWSRAIPENSMIGYSVTRQADLENICMYKKWRVSFLSIEPILEKIKLPRYLHEMKWIIVGAETGNRKGKVVPKLEWLREIHGFAHQYYIPLFFKKSLRSIWPEDWHFPQEYPI